MMLTPLFQQQGKYLIKSVGQSPGAWPRVGVAAGGRHPFPYRGLEPSPLIIFLKNLRAK